MTERHAPMAMHGCATGSNATYIRVLNKLRPSLSRPASSVNLAKRCAIWSSKMKLNEQSFIDSVAICFQYFVADYALQ